jgi:hypothetical protein
MRMMRRDFRKTIVKTRDGDTRWHNPLVYIRRGAFQVRLELMDGVAREVLSYSFPCNIRLLPAHGGTLKPETPSQVSP